METLLTYRWPGNIRQLENAIERACITSRDNLIRVENLPADVMAPVVPDFPFHVDLERPLPELLHEAISAIEQQYIRKALMKTRGKVSQCAKICGLSRRSITAKIAEYKLDKNAFKEVY
jgi:DNA-binding NtrC family response regulator